MIELGLSDQLHTRGGAVGHKKMTFDWFVNDGYKFLFSESARSFDIFRHFQTVVVGNIDALYVSDSNLAKKVNCRIAVNA